MRLNINKKTGYHLKLQKNNILRIYYIEETEENENNESNETRNIPKCVDVNEINSEKLKKFINDFENRYVQLKNVNLDISNNHNNKSVNSNKSVYTTINKKSTPYVVPNQNNKFNNQANANQNNNQSKTVNTGRSVNNNNMRPPAPPPQKIVNNNNSSNINQQNKQSASVSKTCSNSINSQMNRTFQFKVANNSNINTPVMNNAINKSQIDSRNNLSPIEDIAQFDSDKFNLVSTQINSVSSTQQRNGLSEGKLIILISHFI
jgi:hypothetical protein